MTSMSPGAVGEGPARPRRRSVVIGMALLIAVCLGGLVGVLSSSPAASSRQFGYVLDVCVGVITVPRFQVGVTWISPYMSTLPPVFLQNQACATVPWLPFLPQRGGFAFP
jgi:hypothetical protein